MGKVCTVCEAVSEVAKAGGLSELGLSDGQSEAIDSSIDFVGKKEKRG